MKCKKCAQKDVLLDALKKDHEKALKLNDEILKLATDLNQNNRELVLINKSLVARVNELETKLKEATGESCSNDSNDA